MKSNELLFVIIIVLNVFCSCAEPISFPNGLRIKSKKRTSAVANWRPLPRCIANADISGYEISIENRSLGSVKRIFVPDISSRSYRLGPLTPATEYQLTIAAVNSEGAGPSSPPVVFTTK